LSEEDRRTVDRARKIQKFLSQPFLVAEAFTGRPGEHVELPDTVRSSKRIVGGVFWPGAQSPDYQVHTLFPDFVTDLFNGPYWSAVMPQYVGSAHGVYQKSVDITTLLTLAPSTTVLVRSVAGELVAQQKAGVLPAPDSQGNTIYVVHFPPGITIFDDDINHSIGTSCVDFCAYHDHYYNGTEPRSFPFIVMPDISPVFISSRS